MCTWGNPMIANATPVTPRTSAHLDMIRGIAALVVIGAHIRGLFFLDYGELASPSPGMALLYAVTGLGHQAVMVFFVLSGFLIGGSVMAAMKCWTWKRYLVNRFCRLYLVLLPALLLTAGLDYIAYGQPGGHAYFDLPIAHFSTEILAGRHHWSVLLGNALFLQSIFVPTFGSNFPLWSLANEFWYYLLFPALVLIAYSPHNRKRRLTAFLLALLILALLPREIVAGFPIWMMGAAIYALPTLRTGRGLRRGLCLVAAGILIGIVLLSRAQRIPAGWSDPAVGIAFALWLYCLVKNTAPSPAVPPRYQWWAKLFSNCSYSLYAVHFPMVLLIRTSLGTSLWAPTFRNLALGTGTGMAIFLLGWGFSRLTEAHNDAIRARLHRLLIGPHELERVNADRIQKPSEKPAAVCG